MTPIRMDLKGFLAGVMRPDLERHVINVATVCLMRATEEWITRGSSPSLRDRFGPGAFILNRFSRRNPRYTKTQIRAFGSAQPYASPRMTNFYAVAQKLIKGDILAATRSLQRALTDPMRKVIFIRGRGWNIRPKPGRTTAGVNITWPGARNLNKGGAKNKKYMDEFQDLNRGGAGPWIIQRAGELMDAELWGPLDRTPKRRVA